MPLSPVEPLSGHHQLDPFDCGKHPLTFWLKKWALVSHAWGGSRVFVTCEAREIVRGYYAIATAEIGFANAPDDVRSKLSTAYPISALKLARLAVDLGYQHQGVGASLLSDALRRALAVADNVGVKAVVVDALDEAAWNWYRGFGFRPLQEGDPFHLYLLVSEIRASI